MITRFNTFLSFFNLLCLIGFAAYFFSQQEKAVYVNSTQLINEYKGMIEAKKEYQHNLSLWKGNIDTLYSEINKDAAMYEKENVQMSAKERELAKQLIKAKQEKLIDYQKNINEKAAQQDALLTKKIIDEINTYLKVYGNKHQYTIIFASTEYGNIAYGNQKLDVTADVLDGLNNTFISKSNRSPQALR